MICIKLKANKFPNQEITALFLIPKEKLYVL